VSLWLCVTTLGLLETEVCVGDIHRFGSTVLQVTSCRLPCFKFAHKVGSPAILKPFLESGHSGLYYQVREPGTITAGDSIEILERDPRAFTVRARTPSDPGPSAGREPRG
jgi:MOSC domain-containing protein YiiM